MKENHSEDEQLRSKATEEEELQNSAPKKDSLQALKELTSEDDASVTEDHKSVTLGTLLGGDILAGKWFRRNFFFLVMIVVMLVLYVGNRYRCQQEFIETRNLTDTLIDRKYKALTRSSQLKEKMRRSYIQEVLVDTTLKTANTPSYNLKVEE